MIYKCIVGACSLLLLLGCKSMSSNKNVPPAPQKNNPYEKVDIARFAVGLDATFVFVDLQKNIQVIHNEARANTRFSPCSTFKIPNSLIALETGVINDPASLIKWDQKKYPKQPMWDSVKENYGLNWETDHTLQSAFKNSCIWCYKEIAERIGTQRMKTYVERFKYGNMDTSGEKQPFWLGASLRISAMEQVVFLEQFVKNKLGLRAKTIGDGRTVFKREQSGASVLYAKTGGGNNIGWFVGFVENEKNKYVFAFNMAGKSQDIAAKRVDVSLNILRKLGVWM